MIPEKSLQSVECYNGEAIKIVINAHISNQHNNQLQLTASVFCCIMSPAVISSDQYTKDDKDKDNQVTRYS